MSKQLRFLKQIRPLGWLIIAVVLAAVTLMVVQCGGDKADQAAAPTKPTVPPVTLSNEVPASERTQQAIVDSLNQQNPQAMKVRSLAGDSGPFSHAFFCEGCGCGHGFNVDPSKTGPCWTWNGDSERPTIQPSILVRSGNANGPTICHSFVTDGSIQYLADSTHHLAGQTVELTDL